MILVSVVIIDCLPVAVGSSAARTVTFMPITGSKYISNYLPDHSIYNPQHNDEEKTIQADADPYVKLGRLNDRTRPEVNMMEKTFAGWPYCNSCGHHFNNTTLSFDNRECPFPVFRPLDKLRVQLHESGEYEDEHLHGGPMFTVHELFDKAHNLFITAAACTNIDLRDNKRQRAYNFTNYLQMLQGVNIDLIPEAYRKKLTEAEVEQVHHRFLAEARTFASLATPAVDQAYQDYCEKLRAKVMVSPGWGFDQNISEHSYLKRFIDTLHIRETLRTRIGLRLDKGMIRKEKPSIFSRTR